MSSCDPNVTCREKSFQDYTWRNDTPNQMDHFNMTNDSVSYYHPLIGSTIKMSYDFDDNCNGFTVHFPVMPITDYHYAIVKNEEYNIWIQQDGTTSPIKFHR